jgi:hypothetical protein
MRQFFLSSFMKLRLPRLKRMQHYPVETQQLWFETLIRTAAKTEWGQTHHYNQIRTPQDFARQVPVQPYEEFYPWIEKCLQGNASVLWPGKYQWFAKSSGTTNDKSKFIPVSPEAFQDNHFKAGKDLFASYFETNPYSRMANGLNLVIGGSHEVNRLNSGSRSGDLSALLLENLPALYAHYRTPPKEISLMGEWEKKLERMAEIVIRQDIRAMTGVPTWLLVLFERLFEMKQLEDKNLLHIWPNLEVFFHGAVAFGPYREIFRKLIPGDRMQYRETYNASEGFFAFQDQKDSEDLLLLLDHGIYYEFIPMDQWGNTHANAIGIGDVQLNTNYALVISTNSGLWRYVIGDTIKFTSLSPYRIRITGRTKHFINAFGEELIVDNAEVGLQEACRQTGAMISDYTAAPVFLEGKNQGLHEWVIEFSIPPEDSDKFIQVLDEKLQQINSDYAAKRYQNMAMQMPRLHIARTGTFYQWMKDRGKLGGQNKVPRLSNTREYIETILPLL